MNKKKLLLIYLNEFNYEFLKKGALKYKCKYLLKLFQKNRTKIFTKDKIQEKNLDPWVQSISIFTGKSSTKHKIFNISQRIPKKINQISDILVKNKISCSIWGLMNVRRTKNKYMHYFFPDPWNSNEEAFPEGLNKFLQLPKYYAQNYSDTNKFILFYMYIKFFINILFSKTFYFFIRNIFSLSKIFLTTGIKNYTLFFLFDLITLDLIFQKTKKKNSNFCLIFLNSLAHFQHNNWDNKKDERNCFIFVEIIARILIKISNYYSSVIITNGFSQKKIKAEFIIRPKNPINFLKSINLNFAKLNQNMTNGGYIKLFNKKDKLDAINILKNYKVLGFHVFEVHETSKTPNTIFYKIKIKTFKEINENNFQKITKNNYSKFIDFIYSHKTKIIFNKRKDDFLFFNEMIFIKSTGKHINKGIIFYSNIKNRIFNKKNILNHKIFNIVINYFS